MAFVFSLAPQTPSAQERDDLDAIAPLWHPGSCAFLVRWDATLVTAHKRLALSVAMRSTCTMVHALEVAQATRPHWELAPTIECAQLHACAESTIATCATQPVLSAQSAGTSSIYTTGFVSLHVLLEHHLAELAISTACVSEFCDNKSSCGKHQAENKALLLLLLRRNVYILGIFSCDE